MFSTLWLHREAGVALLTASLATFSLSAFAEGPVPPRAASLTLPDAPVQQEWPEAAPPQDLFAAAQQAPPASPPQQPTVQHPDSAPVPPAAPVYDLKRAEHQRVLGIMPEFQAVNGNQVLRPLTPKEKFHLMWKSSTDPFIFSLDAIVAGIGQAKDSNPGYGQGTRGYLKRFGSSYADTFDGNFWGNAVLTVAFKEDPRYFREGEGHSYSHRALYSAGTALWTRRDNGKRGPNYANVLGNFVSGGISNLYYPAADRGLSKTVTGAVTVTAEGTIGSELIEFWPDIARKLFPNQYRRQMDRQGQH